MRRGAVAHRFDVHTLGSWSVFVPRALIVLAVVGFFVVQLGDWSSRFSFWSSDRKVYKINPSKVNGVEHGEVGGGVGGGGGGGGRGASSSVVKKLKSGVGGGAAFKKTGLCYDNPLLKGCRHWLDTVLPRTRYDIVLISNELYPTFPLKGYGGIETAVEILADALNRMGIPFWVVCPARTARPVYPFDVLEAYDSANGRSHMVGTFVWQASDILRLRIDNVGARPTIIDALHDRVGSAPVPMQQVNRSLVVWGQSEWSQNFAQLSDVTITAHHDGGGPLKGWDWHLPNVGHRFLSHDQRDQWVLPTDVSGGGYDRSESEATFALGSGRMS